MLRLLLIGMLTGSQTVVLWASFVGFVRVWASLTLKRATVCTCAAFLIKSLCMHSASRLPRSSS